MDLTLELVPKSGPGGRLESLLPISGNPFPPRRVKVVLPAGKALPAGQKVTVVAGWFESLLGARAQDRARPSSIVVAFRVVIEPGFLRA